MAFFWEGGGATFEERTDYRELVTNGPAMVMHVPESSWNESEAGVDLVLKETLFLFLC